MMWRVFSEHSFAVSFLDLFWGLLFFVKVVHWRFVLCCKWQTGYMESVQTPGQLLFLPVVRLPCCLFAGRPLSFFRFLLETFCWAGLGLVLIGLRTRTRIRNESMQLTWTCMGNANVELAALGSQTVCPGSVFRFPVYRWAAGQINWLQYDWWHCQTAFRNHLLTNLLKQLNESLPNVTVRLGLILGRPCPWRYIADRPHSAPQSLYDFGLRFSGTTTGFDFCFIHAAMLPVRGSGSFGFGFSCALLFIVCSFSFAHATA